MSPGARAVQTTTVQCYFRFTDYSFLSHSIQLKRDNKRQTGSGGGWENVLDDLDIKILDILDKDSPAVDGLPVLESFDSPPPPPPPPPPSSESHEPPPKSNTKERKLNTLSTSRVAGNSSLSEEAVLNLKNKWLELQNQKAEAYLSVAPFLKRKYMLQCAQLEKFLGLPVTSLPANGPVEEVETVEEEIVLLEDCETGIFFRHLMT